jgi:methyl-accepting chemotaxis protein
MKAGDEKVATGVRLATEASRSLEEILEVCNRGAEMAERIAAAAEEQSTAVVEVSASMDDMAQITRRSEGSTQEVRACSVELQQIADELSGMASWFRQAAA